MGKVRIIADSTCDLSDELKERYDIKIIPLCIIMDDKSYFDMENVTPKEIFEWADKNKTTPKTSAGSIEKAMSILKPFCDAGEDIIFIGISDDMSTNNNVIRLAGEELNYDRLFVVNGMNLSTGTGLEILRACDLAEEGNSAEEIVAAIEGARENVRASFVVDTMTYLARGGRCSSVTALLANTLQIHPKIIVKGGKMEVAAKYRGKMDRVLAKYRTDMEQELLNADPKRVFVTHSGGLERETVEAVKTYLKELNYFENIYETNAGGVICSHCGPGTLGILFYAKP